MAGGNRPLRGPPGFKMCITGYERESTVHRMLLGSGWKLGTTGLLYLEKNSLWAGIYARTYLLFCAPSNAGFVFRTGFFPFGTSGFNLT